MNRNTYKWGIGVLKILLCFCVILIHYGQGSSITQIFSALMSSAVPCFMIITFYFNSKIINEGNTAKIRDRVFRLIIPCIIWGGIYFVAYKLMYYLKLRDYDLSWKDLLWQLLTGHSYNAPLWYMYVLIILTVLFSIVLSLCKNRHNIILFIILLFSLFYLYSEWNGIFFELRWELKWPLGRLVEMLPYSAIGLLIGFNKDKIEKMKWKYKIGSLGGLFIIWIVCLGLETYGILFVKFNYGYSGLSLFFKSIFIFLMCLYISYISINGKVEELIVKISRYTLGIYCMHVLIGECIILFLSNHKIEINRFLIGIVIFILCYILCYGIVKIPIKGIKNIVS